MSDEATVITSLVVAVIVSTLMFLGGVQVGEENIRTEAIKSGHLEFYMETNGSKQWRWK